MRLSGVVEEEVKVEQSDQCDRRTSRCASGASILRLTILVAIDVYFRRLFSCAMFGVNLYVVTLTNVLINKVLWT